jgi:SAM-dependent methyltransferase
MQGEGMSQQELLPQGREGDAWSQLWAKTTIGSVDLDGNDPLATSLRRHWAGQVQWLSGLSSVVDVGSGPAILARHLQASAPAGVLDGLTWWCLDNAELPPSPLVSARIELQGSTDFAASSPSQGPCDGLVSNFGIEYVPREHLASACARWLRPGGRLSAVLHAAGSVIDQTARQTLDDIAYALRPAGLFDRAVDLVGAIETVPADPTKRREHAPEVRSAYNEAVDDLKSRMAVRNGTSAAWIDMLTSLTGMIQRRLRGEADHAAMSCAALRDAYVAEHGRLVAMRSNAIGAEEQLTLDAAFLDAGFSAPHWQPVQSSVGLVAWHLTARLNRR